MSLKENIGMIKEELSSEEKFFEKAVMTEKFVTKYKKLMIASVVGVVILVGANFAYEMNKQNTITAANETLRELQKDPKDQAALSRLQSLSPALYDVWIYSQAIAANDLETLKKLQNSKTTLIGDLATYERASALGDEKALEEYEMRQNGIYRDLAIIQSAILLMDKGEIDQAHTKLQQISQDSSMASLAKVLLHYGVK